MLARLHLEVHETSVLWTGSVTTVRVLPYIQCSRCFQNLRAAKEDIIIQYTYPRLDAEVSKRRNHLLKAPFCIHPKTGRVCVPIDPRTIDSFNPERVPTVQQLLRELDKIAPSAAVAGEAGEGATAVAEHHSDWERTSLKPYVDMLDKHVMGLMEETRKAKQKMGARSPLLPKCLGMDDALTTHFADLSW